MLAQPLPKAGLSAATMSTELPQAFTGTVTGTWTSLPERTPAESLVVPFACVSEKAELPHRDRMLVAAAAATTPLLRVCRNLVVFLLEEVGKADLGTWSGCPRPARIRPYGRGVARRQSLTQTLPIAGFTTPVTLTVLPHTLAWRLMGA